MRKALVVGINDYDSIASLHGCVNDAYDIKAMLERHADGSVNFGVHILTSSTEHVTRSRLRDSIRELFDGDSDVAALYFAGHGYIDPTGGYICASDTMSGDDGIALSDIMTFAVKSKARNKFIILDSCHSGGIAQNAVVPNVSELSDGMTILTASTAEQYASEQNGSGVFTSLLVDALGGAAANLVGAVTPGGVYAHIDQSLGPWAQRPMFKTNVKSFVSLRQVQPPLELRDLRMIAGFFPASGFEFKLDPSYEPESHDPDPDKNAIFSVLQKFNRVNLLVPVGAPHMYHAAMESKSVRLTALGEHYRRLVEKGLL
ncbi:peptidase C14 [Kaistia algarum]|uniref:caspase family protein n=1 Tax=Kaistia algarum TaxID=2083279 RepID=UPI000CE86DF4|nr:caspase family protein [Kaistia algarum]MCX5512441.1 caspase family protein [Kaistia algarum]PPE80520.1 peptidase C14 [Kaistia algarum]